MIKLNILDRHGIKHSFIVMLQEEYVNTPVIENIVTEEDYYSYLDYLEKKHKWMTYKKDALSSRVYFILNWYFPDHFYEFILD